MESQVPAPCAPYQFLGLVNGLFSLIETDDVSRGHRIREAECDAPGSASTVNDTHPGPQVRKQETEVGG
jgi:hypothetical protein